MPIYLMGERTRSVTIPSQALALSISGSVDDAALNVRAAADQPVVRSSPHLSVLPIIIGPLTISVEPVRGGFFGPDTVVQLAIGPDTADDVDPVQVVFDPVDVSGDSDVELATLTPAGTRIEIAVSAVADRPLSRLGTAARAAARKVIGRRSEPSGDAVVIAVDASASMRSAFSDGSVSAAADIVVGVADAVGDHERVGRVGRGETRTGPRRTGRRIGGFTSQRGASMVRRCTMVDNRRQRRAHRGVHRLSDTDTAATVSGPCHLDRSAAGNRLRGAASAPPGCRRLRRGAQPAGGAGTHRGLTRAGLDVTKCPRCFSVLGDDHYAWMVDPRIARVPRYADAAASAYYGAAVTSPPIYDANPPPGYKGRLHTAADASAAMNGLPVVEICPICHFELPGGWRQGQAVCIAMAGARATGKSIYIAVLIKQLELLCETLGVSMNPTTQAAAQAYCRQL